MGVIYYFASKLHNPYFVLYTACLLALLNLWRRRRETRRRLLLLTVPFALLAVLSLPVAGYLLLGSLEWINRPTDDIPEDTDAIVVLAGGITPADSLRPRDELSPSYLVRLVHASEVYRRRPGPLVLIEAKRARPEPGGSESADLAPDLLVRLGVAPENIKMLGDSLTTYTDARIAAKYFGENRMSKRIILITEAVHSFRATRCFRSQGFTVSPSACRYRTTGFQTTVFQFLPNPSTASDGQLATHEWVGILWYWLSGKLK